MSLFTVLFKIFFIFQGASRKIGAKTESSESCSGQRVGILNEWVTLMAKPNTYLIFGLMHNFLSFHLNAIWKALLQKITEKLLIFPLLKAQKIAFSLKNPVKKNFYLYFWPSFRTPNHMPVSKSL